MRRNKVGKREKKKGKKKIPLGRGRDFQGQKQGNWTKNEQKNPLLSKEMLLVNSNGQS